MTTIRARKDRNCQFVQLFNSMFHDKNISLKAMGFIGHCMTKPENWVFYVDQLASALKEGKRAIRSAMDECVKHGYAIRFQTRKPNGDFGHWELIISDSKEEIQRIKDEMKESGQIQKSFTDCCFADAQNSTLQKNECTKERSKDIRSPKETNKEKTERDKNSLLQGKNKENFEVMKAYLETHNVPIRDFVLVRWFTKWDLDHINYHLGLMLKSKTLIDNAEAWMEKALSKNYEELENTIEINKKWAEDYKEQQNFYDLLIFRKYCRHSKNQYNIMYNLEHETFKEELKNCFHNYKYR